MWKIEVHLPRSAFYGLGRCAANLILLGCILGRSSEAQEVKTLRLTLRDAVQIALRQNPQVQIASLNIAESQSNQAIARSALLPQISGNASESVRRLNLQTALGRTFQGFPGHIGPFWVSEAGAAGSAPLLDVSAWLRWQASKDDVTGTRADNQTVREQYVQLVVSQYLGSWRAAADVQAAQSRMDLAKALFDQAADLQRSGAGTGIDTLRANVQYQNERQRVIQAQTGLRTSLYGLARLLNLAPDVMIELADVSEFFVTPPSSADENLERAWMQRPEMQALDARIRAAETQKRAVQAERVPKLNVTGNWAEQGLEPTKTIPVYEFAASIDFPLFTGGRIGAQASVADIEAKKLMQELTDVRNRITLEVRTAAAELNAAREEVEVANLGVDLARQEVMQARDRFEAGVANNIEVITAQDELARANDNQITALYRYNQARADLAHATGQMEALYGR